MFKNLLSIYTKFKWKAMLVVTAVVGLMLSFELPNGAAINHGAKPSAKGLARIVPTELFFVCGVYPHIFCM